MDLTEVGRALRRFWLLALVVFVLIVAAGYLASTGRSAQRFEATTTLSVSPNPAIGGSYDSIQYQLPVMLERISSRSFRELLGETVPAEVLGKVSELSAENEVAVLVNITARGSGRDAVAEVANAAAAAIIAYYEPLDSLDATTAAVGGPVVIEVITEAVPDRSGGRSATPTVLASVVLGAIVATGATVLAQRWSHSRDLATRVRKQLDLPVLAVIPEVGDLGGGESELAGQVASGPAPFADAVQDFRSRAEAPLGDKGGVLAVTSWQREDGRTTLTAALALAFASISRDVVAVDADIARPALHRRLGVAPAAGSSGSDDASRDLVVQPTPHRNLRVVAAGGAEGHPAQVLAGELPAVVLEVTATSPDTIVIIDAPPLQTARRGSWVGVPAETATVLRAAQHTVLVVDAARTHLDDLTTAVDHLRDGGVTVVGAVINRHRRRWTKG